MEDILLKVHGVHHGFPGLPVLHDVNLKIQRGQVVGLVGPSGCGKSTLLRAIVGTHLPNEGEILVQDRVITGPARDRGIVYQHYSLYPFLTALQNVAFGLMLDESSLVDRWIGYFSWRRKRKKHEEEAAAMLESFGLGKALHRYPHQLSGGMRQRVAIAQALILKPEILVLDEPFGALDEATREDLQDVLLDLYRQNQEASKTGEKPPYTVMIVTHELNEALYVSNRVVGLSQYWRYEDDGHESCPGATILYDAAAPTFHPDQGRDYELFIDQRREIREIVFAAENRRKRGEHLSYWDEQGTGDRGPGTGDRPS